MEKVMSTDASGASIARRFRVAYAPTLVSRVVPDFPITVSRIRCDDPEHGLTRCPPMEDAYVAQVLLRDVPSVDLWLHGRQVPLRPSPAGGLFLFNFQSSPVVRFHSPFDFVRFYIPQQAINELARGNGGRAPEGLSRPEFGEVDAILYHLACAVVPALDAPAQANQLFTDYVALAFHAHLTASYPGACRDLSKSTRGLAPWQARRVRELIDAHLDGRIAIPVLAAECRLSAGHFARAFLQTFGTPPHRWLLHRRVEHAKVLINQSTLTLAEVGSACGFTTQSHFSRVFMMLTGTTPTNWRRMTGHMAHAADEGVH
jgi:AraC-like DNA-binding protein